MAHTKWTSIYYVEETTFKKLEQRYNELDEQYEEENEELQEKLFTVEEKLENEKADSEIGDRENEELLNKER